MAEIISKKRNRKIVLPRQVAMYLCRNLTEASFPQIGDQFGGRNHTTVIHSTEKIEDELKKDQDLAIAVKNLYKIIDPNSTAG
jgi:chromosomal replication initiator protein